MATEMEGVMPPPPPPLPEDVLRDILLTLPVKSLLRSKSVCKNWYALIENPSFVSLHHHHNRANDDCLLVNRFLDGATYECTALSLVPPNGTPIEHVDLDVPFTGLEVEVNGIYLLGYSHGLLCLGYSHDPLSMGLSGFVIYNIATREFRQLSQAPYHTRRTSHLGFAFDPISNDFKVVRVATLYQSDIKPFDAYDLDSYDDFCQALKFGESLVTPVDEKVHVYDLSADSWREIDTVLPEDFMCDFRPCCWQTSLDGVVYWADPHFPAIVAFPMFDEEFKQLPFPDVPLDFMRKLSILCTVNDCLAMVLYTEFAFSMSEETCFDIWVMHGYGVQVSWSKKYTIGPLLGGCFFAFGFRQNGEFLLLRCEDRRMVSYNCNTQEMKEYPDVYDNQIELEPPGLQVLSFTESLMSVKR